MNINLFSLFTLVAISTSSAMAQTETQSQIFLSESATKRLKQANGAQTESTQLNLVDLLKKELYKKGFSVQPASASRSLYDRRGNFKVPNGAKFIDSESVTFSNVFVQVPRMDDTGNPIFDDMRAIQEKRIKCEFKLVIREAGNTDQIFYEADYSNQDDPNVLTAAQCDAKVRQLILDIPHL